MPQSPASVRAAARIHTDALLRLPNVFAVGVGARRVRGVVTDEPGVVMYVTRKLPPDALAQADRVPTHLEADGDLVRTDVLEAAQPHFVDVDTATYRPVHGGCQIGTSGRTGTAGAVVYDRRDQSVVLLTNNHVLTGMTQPWTLPADTTVRQPAGGAAVGFSKRIVPIFPAPLGADYRYYATVDAGIVELDPDITGAFDVLEIGRHPFVVLPPFEGLEVVRRGYRTQLRTGTVELVHLAVTIKANNGDLVRIGGDDAVFSIRSPERLISAMPGDSGSLVVDAAGGAARGLVFASDSQSGGLTWACELGTVMQLLEVDTPCTGGLRAAIRRAVFRRFTPAWASAHIALEGGHRNRLVDEVVTTVGRFRKLYLSAEPDGTLGSAIGVALQRLGPDLAGMLNNNEDAAGLFDRAFGEWFVQPTVFDMLEYRFPEDTPERMSAAFGCLRDTCSAREDLELLTTAFSSAARRSMRETLRDSTSDLCNRIASAAGGTA